MRNKAALRKVVFAGTVLFIVSIILSILILINSKQVTCLDLDKFSSPELVEPEYINQNEKKSIDQLKENSVDNLYFDFIDSNKSFEQFTRENKLTVLQQEKDGRSHMATLSREGRMQSDILISYDQNNNPDYIIFEPSINLDFTSLLEDLESPTEAYEWIKVKGMDSRIYSYNEDGGLTTLLVGLEGESKPLLIVYGYTSNIQETSEKLYKVLQSKYCKG